MQNVKGLFTGLFLSVHKPPTVKPCGKSDDLLSEHKTDFSSLFNRVEFTLEGGYDELPTDKRIKNMNKKGDDYSLVALLFQYGRYLTIS